jgi:hypothetical protein
MGFPLAPVTATITVIVCAIVMLDEDGVTVIVGVAFVTVIGSAAPVAAV